MGRTCTRRLSMSTVRWLAVCVAALILVAQVGSGAYAKKEEGRTNLPEVVAKAFKDAFPKGEIAKADAEKEGGIEIYDIEFREGESERECDIAADGAILDTAIVVDAKSLPDAALKAIEKAAEGGTIKRIEKTEIRAEAKAGKITKFDKARIEFEAEIKKGDRFGEVVVAEDGKIVEAVKWLKKGPEHEEDE